MPEHKVRSFGFRFGPFDYHGVLVVRTLVSGWECAVSELTCLRHGSGSPRSVGDLHSPTQRHGLTLDACLSQLGDEVEAFCRADAIARGWRPNGAGAEIADV